MPDPDACQTKPFAKAAHSWHHQASLCTLKLTGAVALCLRDVWDGESTRGGAPASCRPGPRPKLFRISLSFAGAFGIHGEHIKM